MKRALRSAGPWKLRLKDMYRWYILGLLLVIFAINFIDRQIIVILAPYLKRDLGITDAQIGLLYGTTFAVFYSIFGIPLAKLADGWSRKWTLAGGLFIWSGMTTLSGLASNYGQLGLARLAVGVGEASAQPAAVSLLSDYFPKRIRGTIFAIYMLGIYLGWGCSLIIGGAVVGMWPGWLGLAGWQAAFLVVGLPGVLLAVVVALTVREPVRGKLDGHAHSGSPAPFRDVIREFRAMVAPWSFAPVHMSEDRSRLLRQAIRCAVILFVLVGLLAALTELISPTRDAPVFTLLGMKVSSAVVQWLIVGTGVFLTVNWSQAIRMRDPVAYSLTVGGTAFRLVAVGSGLLSIYTYAIGAFVFLYGTRYVGLVATDGMTLGVLSVISGGIGTTLGGVLGDLMKRFHPAGRVFYIMLAMIAFAMTTVVQFTTSDRGLFFAACSISLLLLTSWSPLMMATGQDLVLARLRGLAVAIQTLATALIGLALGPYLVGLVSDLCGSLRLAILSPLVLMPLLMFILWRCALAVPRDEMSLRERARLAGEAI